MGSVGAKRNIISTPLGDFKNLDDVENAVREALGINATFVNKEERDEYRQQIRDLFDKQRELDAQYFKLMDERDKERIPTTDPDVLALGRTYASMFGKYTERGEEIRQQMRALDAQRKDVGERLDALRAKAKEFDEDQRDLDKRFFKTWYGAPREPLRPITPQDIDRDYRLHGNQGFASTTATSNLQDALERGDAYIVHMSPKEYIHRVGFDIFNASLDKTVRGTDWGNVVKYAKEMREGTRYYMPWLDYKNRGQEGRHRALAAILNGYEHIPVAVRLW